MTKFDKEYIRLGETILNKGVLTSNRTGIDTIGIPNWNFEFDLKDEFPILETKQTYFRQAVLEMLSIWQVGTNDVNWLQERGVNIWDEWQIDKDGIYRIYEPEIPGKEYIYDSNKEVTVYDPMSLPEWDTLGQINEMKPKLDENGKVMKAKSLIPGKTIRAAKYFGRDLACTYGKTYGYIANKDQMMFRTEYLLKNGKYDRRIVNSLWQPDYFREAVLPPCVYEHEFVVKGNKVHLIVRQRSCDVPLGLPFNITQYATLLRMMAQVSGLEVGKMYWSTGDAHIYINQIEEFREQVARWKKYQEMSLWSKSDLLSRQLELSNLYNEAKMFLDKNDPNLLKMDSELKIIDMILNPSKPELWLNPDVTSFFDFDHSRGLKDAKIKNYKHMGPISFQKAQ